MILTKYAEIPEVTLDKRESQNLILAPVSVSSAVSQAGVHTAMAKANLKTAFPKQETTL